VGENSRAMVSVPRIQVGQIWKNDQSGENYIVTQIYTEALSTIAVLRKAGAELEAARLRVKVRRVGDGQGLPGFSPAQGSEM